MGTKQEFSRDGESHVAEVYDPKKVSYCGQESSQIAVTSDLLDNHRLSANKTVFKRRLLLKPFPKF